LHYNYFGKTTNDPSTAIYIDEENTSILAINRKRRLASDAGTLMPMMPDNINATYDTIFGEKHKLTPTQKTGASATGYYCNINQNIKMPDVEGTI